MKRSFDETGGGNLCAVLVEQGKLELRERPLPKVKGPLDVLVQVKRVGICGSDVEYWRHGRIGDFVLRAPMVIGHESSGIVVDVGRDVSSVKAGDRVAMEPGVSCGACSHCLSGTYNLCADMRFFATPPVDGSLCQYVVHPSHLCFPLPEAVSLEEGALCEPLAVGVHACRRARITMGSRVAVFGCGPIGIICMLTAKAFGATWVAMTDVREDRLKFARSMGADHTVNVAQIAGGPGAVAQNLAQAAAQADGSCDGNAAIPAPLDATFECCGMEAATTAAIKVTRSGGTVCCVGLRDQTMQLPIMESNVREVDIRGIFRYANAYPACIALLQGKRLGDISRLITHRFGLKDMQRGFDTAIDPQANAIKVMFEL